MIRVEVRRYRLGPANLNQKSTFDNFVNSWRYKPTSWLHERPQVPKASPETTLKGPCIQEATYGQMHDLLSQLPYKCARNPGASVSDRLEIYPWVASRLEEQPRISHLIRRKSQCSYGLPTVGSYEYSRLGHSGYR
jgi:hypothetical protein